MAEPVIRLVEYQIDELHYSSTTKLPELEEIKELSFNSKGGLTGDRKHGRVMLSAKIPSNSKDKRTINLTISGYFEITDNKLETKKIHEFLGVNGTAILLPYLRSIISMVSSFDASDGLIFPTLNVSDLFSNEKSEDK